MSKAPTIPLKVRAFLTDGRLNAHDGIIMLDAILYHAWFIKHAPKVLLDGGVDNWSGYIGLPLRQLPNNRWAASRGIYEQIGESVEHWNKRPDFFRGGKSNYLSIDKGLISDSVGVYRAHRTQNIIRIVKDGVIDFYCVGNPDKIMELLCLMSAVGKKTSMGYGEIKKWEISEESEDYSFIHPEHGLMRPTPIDECEAPLDYPVINYAIRPPYWKQVNAKLCYVPVEE